MGRYFNTEGQCEPDIHYMVPLDDRLEDIRKRYVDRGSYFVVNCGRQYGKTTTLRSLARYLMEDYIAVFLDFQELGTREFQSEAFFSAAFARLFLEAFRNVRRDQERALEPLVSFQQDKGDAGLMELFDCLSQVCGEAPEPVVLMIDEVDSASNNQVFIDFLALLRRYYLNRKAKPAFHCVILAGVYDIKNLKRKLRPNEDHQYNSPWNIAARFNVDMSFSVGQIAAMLREYERDHETGMDCDGMAGCIYEYTSGYPYLVSAICKFLDEDIPGTEGFEDRKQVWTAGGVTAAVGILLEERLPLFESMTRQLEECGEMKQMLQAILFQGRRMTYNPDQPMIGLASMFGYIVNRDKCVQVANRIFEMRLYNLFLSEEELTAAIYREAQKNRSQFLEGDRLDMELVLRRFVEHFTEIYGDNDAKFVEEYGRKFFLLYLKPIINGTGHYYIEARTRDARRTDVIVDYQGEQFVIELKIWHGSEYNERGEKQLADYLDDYHLEKGYMLSFNFNKRKETGVKKVRIGGKTLVEAVV